jgi:hypothetical protein
LYFGDRVAVLNVCFFRTEGVYRSGQLHGRRFVSARSLRPSLHVPSRFLVCVSLARALLLCLPALQPPPACLLRRQLASCATQPCFASIAWSRCLRVELQPLPSAVPCRPPLAARPVAVEVLSYGLPWAHYLGGYQDRLLGGPLGLPGLRCTAPDGVKHKDYRGEVLG